MILRNPAPAGFSFLFLLVLRGSIFATFHRYVVVSRNLSG